MTDLYYTATFSVTDEKWNKIIKFQRINNFLKNLWLLMSFVFLALKEKQVRNRVFSPSSLDTI
jgi:hypothetical protein